MRPLTLNTSSAGMTRLRTKGGASPESLYELYNAYITASKAPKQRPGVPYTFSCPSLSKGLVLYKGTFYTFSAAPVAAVAGSTNLVLVHPSAGYAGTLKAIHFAQPFMGYLYVVAEFNASGSIPVGVFHYWLQMPKAWTALTQYKANDLVQPTVPNGLYYRALQSTTAAAAWTAGIVHKWGDYVQPTVYNGFQYKATRINGDFLAISSQRAASGQTEPIWPLTIAATVIEVSSGAINIDPAPSPDPPDAKPPGLRDGGGDDSRYKNIGGSFSGGRGWTPIRVR